MESGDLYKTFRGIGGIAMLWRDKRKSSNVEDRRHMPSPGLGGMGDDGGILRPTGRMLQNCNKSNIVD